MEVIPAMYATRPRSWSPGWMPAAADSGDNVPVETGDRRLWQLYVRDVLRPEKAPARPSRRALVTDATLAIALTAAAVVAAGLFPGGDPFLIAQPQLIEPLRLQQLPPALPSLPLLPPLPGAGLPGQAEPAMYEAVLVGLTASPLAARRRFPLVTFWAVLAAALLTSDVATWVTVLTCAIAAYGVIAYGRNRPVAVASLALAAVLAGAAFESVAPGLPTWLGPFVVLLSAGVLAGFVRFWPQRQADLRRAQEEATRRAVEEERSRIAGELHDVVTHNVSVMLIQAGAARKVMDMAPQEAKQALLSVEAGGRAAMAELRHVMGLLAGPDGDHPGDPADGLEPQPGLDRLDTLVERVRGAGMTVHVTTSLPSGPLPAGIDLAAYRVVQEALTNTIKHAAGATVTVAIECAGDWLEIEVTDTGATRKARKALPRSGRGLIGLRERLAVYGGTLDAGPSPGGGYQIKAHLPWTPA